MPWCPKCGSEYRNDFNRCPDCGTDLVDELASTEAPEAGFDTEAYLTTVADEVQANVIESLLRSFNIHAARNYREAGSYVKVFTGASSFGIDIYVPSRDLDEAREILKNSMAPQSEDSEGAHEFKSPGRAYGPKRHFARWLILLFFVIAFLIPLVMAVIRHVLTNIN